MKCRIYFVPLDIELKEATTECADEEWKVHGFDCNDIMRVVMLDKDSLPIQNT